MVEDKGKKNKTKQKTKQKKKTFGSVTQVEQLLYYTIDSMPCRVGVLRKKK